MTWQLLSRHNTQHSSWKKELINWTSLNVKTSTLPKIACIMRIKRQVVNGETFFFTKHRSNEGLVPKIYKGLSSSWMTKSSQKTGQKIWSSTEKIQMEYRYIKRYVAMYVIRKLQIETMKNHYTPMRMAKIQTTDNIECWCGLKEKFRTLLMEMQNST